MMRKILIGKLHKKLKKREKKLITIIIPRHVNRTNEIIDTLNNLDLNCITHSSNQKLQEDTDVYLVDSYGESSKFYNLTNVCFCRWINNKTWWSKSTGTCKIRKLHN